MRPVVVLEEAAEDIECGRDFYDLQEAGVGDYFVDSIIADIECLGLLHGIHAKHFGFYRLLSDRFPFGIYYRETAETTEVFAILDLRQNPAWIHEELSSRSRGAEAEVAMGSAVCGVSPASRPFGMPG